MAEQQITSTVPFADKEGTTTSASTNGGQASHRFFDTNPNANLSPQAVVASFGGEFQPGLFRSVRNRKFANPAPLGLCGFGLTTFVLSAVNLSARGVTAPSIVVPLAFAYGGLVQLLAGMWEMAVGNTFGATALSSYGGFWIAWALLEAPYWGDTDSVAAQYGGEGTGSLDSAVGFFLTGWFIFTTILLLCTLRSTVIFFLLFFTLDLAFLFLSCQHFAADNGNLDAASRLKKAGGVFGMAASFLAWYNAFAGIADSSYGRDSNSDGSDSNSFFLIPVFHFPWSEKGREARAKAASAV